MHRNQVSQYLPKEEKKEEKCGAINRRMIDRTDAYSRSEWEGWIRCSDDLRRCAENAEHTECFL